MTPATRKAHARAVASGHPSVARSSAPELSGSAASPVEQPTGERGLGRSWYPAPVRSDVVDAPPPRDTMSADPDAAASGSTPFDDFHATVTDINDAADRLRVLLRRGSPDAAVEAPRESPRVATTQDGGSL